MMVVVVLSVDAVAVVVVHDDESDVVVRYNQQYQLYRNKLKMPIGTERSNKIHSRVPLAWL